MTDDVSTVESGPLGLDSEESDIDSVSDEESVSQRRSLERIQSLWDEVADIRAAIARDELTNEIPREQRRRAYYRSVRNLWIGLKPHLGRANDDLERRYLLDLDLGTVTINPPPVLQQNHEVWGDRLRLLAGESWPVGVTHDFTGFAQFEEADVLLSAQWRVGIDLESFETSNYRKELLGLIEQTDPQMGEVAYIVPERDTRDFDEPFTITKQKLLPEHIIEKAFQALIELTDELGAGLRLGDGDPHGKT